MGLKSKPAAIKVQPGHLTKECVGCEVEWHKDGNPFDKKDAYLVTWDDESVTIKLKSKSKKHRVPYEHVILHYIQMERGWIFDGGSKMAVTPEMRDPYYLTHIDEPEMVSDNSQQQDQEQQKKEETPTKESKSQQKESPQTTQKKEQTPKKSQQQSKSKTTNTSKQQPSSKKTSSTKKSTTRKQKGDANAFVAKKSSDSSKKPSLKNNLI